MDRNHFWYFHYRRVSHHLALARILAFLMGWFSKDSLQLITFQSYGTDSNLYVHGRALEDENIDLTRKGLFGLLKNSWKRFESDEVAHTRIRITLPDNRTFYTETDEKGYFKLKTQAKDLRKSINSEGWLPYEVSYVDPHPGWVINNDNRFPGAMLIPSATARYGVISDIDDTILSTGVTSFLKLRLIFNTFFRHAESRIPLKGASNFYLKLHQGITGNDANPLFYVSHGPWNLYRYLELFLKANTFPKGPIRLRDFPNPFRKKNLSEKPQKQIEILNILEMYPQMGFVLIGDSGERDADIYIEIAEAFPDRIQAIYLRSVRHKKKMHRIQGLFEQFDTTPALLIRDSQEAIDHAYNSGFIAKPS